MANLPVISDRSSLVTAVQTWVDRDDDTFISALPIILSNAEARIRRNQNWFSRVFSVSNGGTALNVGANPTQLPSHVKTIRSMWASTDQWKHPLTQLSFDELRRLAMTNRDAAAIPTKYAIVAEMDLWMDDDTATAGPLLYLWPQPTTTDGQSFAVDSKYVFDPSPLVNPSDTNALLRRHPDVYFYAALAETAPYLLHDERLPLWESRYQQVVKEINSEREAAEVGAPNKRINLPVVF